MSVRFFEFSPIDSWFFRDGRPFNQGEATQANATSLFPPFSPTLVGSIRSMIARANGWDGKSNWKDQLGDKLGPSLDDLSPLKTLGPFVLKDGRPLFPMPLHVLGKVEASADQATWTAKTLLRPGERAIRCDLNEKPIRFPEQEHPERGLKAGENLWVTTSGLDQIMNGNLPDPQHVVSERNLWHREARVGLERHFGTRVAKQGMLYAPHHIRLDKSITIGLGLTELHETLAIPEQFLAPLGGEGRIAHIQTIDTLPSLPPHHLNKKRLTITLLTPMLPDGDWWKTPGANAPTPLNGYRVISGCVGKPLVIGGWDGINRCSLPMDQYLPAGSTWFLEPCENRAPTAIYATDQHIHLGNIASTQFGFGLIAIGTWNNLTTPRS